MPPTRKFESGHAKRQKKRKEECFKKSQSGAMDKFVFKRPQCEENQSKKNDMNFNNVENNVEDPIGAVDTENVEDLMQEETIEEEDDAENVEDPMQEEPMEEEDDVPIEEPSLNSNDGDIPFNINDPRNWDNLDAKWKDLLVKNGPVRDMLTGKGPKDGLKRRFSSEFYSKYLPNGEKHHRDWLVYSKDLDKVFCFCCKLFKNKPLPSQLAHDGLRDWGHLAFSLKTHERSPEHVNNMFIWVDLRLRLEGNQVIDKVLQHQISKETKHWREVLRRLFAIVKYLAKQSLAFRGNNERIYEESNGNFMALVEMVAEWDSTLKEHIRRKQNHEIQYHYLSHKVQNELIKAVASEIKGSILQKIKEAKYFSVILDCTPDVSKQEQMTLILRCVDVSTIPIKVHEYFVEFLVVNDTTGQGLFEELQNVLHHLDLDIDNVRRQAYDNGSNMKGKHKGVQRKLLDINPRAFYTPCGSHSHNLTLSDVAKCCDKADLFFGVVQRIYTLFADSTKRWKILTDNISEKGFTLKSLSTTRWESRFDSVKAIVTQAPEIREALLDLAENETDSSIKSQATCLAEDELGKYEFIVGMVIWYHILAKVNIVSKKLQSENMRIDVAMDSVHALIAFFKEYREVGFEKALNCAKEIAAELEIDPVFPELKKKRRVRKKKHFDKISTAEIVTESTEPVHEESAEESFRIHYFVYIIDQAIGSLERRFEQYKQYEETFGFLFTTKKLKSLDAEELKTSCNNLEQKLQNNHISDIDGEDLFNELQLLQKHLQEDLHDTTSAILNFLKRANCYPTTCLAYRILLTIPITVASAERSFSKLKILKSYLRSTMSQERLNALAVISIEKEFLEKLDYESLIDDFASKNARRSLFRKSGNSFNLLLMIQWKSLVVIRWKTMPQII
ncbi:hypothetical protein ACLB2K_023079 [Fragaria x ananassa]